jgi:hypothetical protein
MSKMSAALVVIMMATASACALDEPKDDEGQPVGPEAAPEESKPTRSGMVLRGFDAEVARANGFEIVTLPDGATASVPKELAQAAASGEYQPTEGVLPAQGGGTDGGFESHGYGSGRGECGTSWVDISPIGNHKASLSSGMDLVSAAGSVSGVTWHINIHDTGGTSQQGYGTSNGVNYGVSWVAYTRILGLSPGFVDATIVWYSSWVATSRGWLCYSVGPTATDTIY